jgi:hypothetical protein
MNWLYRAPTGLQVMRRPDAEIPPHLLTIFGHAVGAFGDFVRPAERITCLDWCERIEARYAASGARGDRVVSAIQASMLDPLSPVASVEHGCAADADLTRYAQAGYGRDANPFMRGSAACSAHALGQLFFVTGRSVPRDVRLLGSGRIAGSGMTFLFGADDRFERIA